MTDETRLKTRLSELRAALRNGTPPPRGRTITGPQFRRLVQLRRDDRRRFAAAWFYCDLESGRNIASLSKSEAWRLINTLLAEVAE